MVLELLHAQIPQREMKRTAEKAKLRVGLKWLSK